MGSVPDKNSELKASNFTALIGCPYRSLVSSLPFSFGIVRL
jgi:hypothetical protein